METEPQAEPVVDATPKRRKTDGQPKLTGKGRPKKNPNMARNGKHKHDKEIHFIERQAEALEYRKMGYTYAQIAQSLGMGCAQTAWNAVENALKATIQEAADDVRRLELERLDAMFISAYGNAIKGDLVAHTACLNIMKRRAALQGLDAPEKRELTGADGKDLSLTPTTIIIGGEKEPGEPDVMGESVVESTE